VKRLPNPRENKRKSIKIAVGVIPSGAVFSEARDLARIVTAVVTKPHRYQRSR
jgi:hypothetical protein